jgi:hypothetical protein
VVFGRAEKVKTVTPEMPLPAGEALMSADIRAGAGVPVGAGEEPLQD